MKILLMGASYGRFGATTIHLDFPHGKISTCSETQLRNLPIKINLVDEQEIFYTFTESLRDQG